jgi:hypothetical protein
MRQEHVMVQQRVDVASPMCRFDDAAQVFYGIFKLHSEGVKKKRNMIPTLIVSMCPHDLIAEARMKSVLWYYLLHVFVFF